MIGFITRRAPHPDTVTIVSGSTSSLPSSMGPTLPLEKSKGDTSYVKKSNAIDIMKACRCKITWKWSPPVWKHRFPECFYRSADEGLCFWPVDSVRNHFATTDCAHQRPPANWTPPFCVIKSSKLWNVFLKRN